MSTPAGHPPAPSEPQNDLTFVSSDLGRDEPEVEEPGRRTVTAAGAPATAVPSFHVIQATPTARRAAGDELPWVARDAPAAPAPAPADSPWTVRRSEQWMRNSASTMRRLRQEAVNLSWTAAWLAVGAAEPKRRSR